ncbi:MAG: DMT family transporter [Alphaproteobacteria bacterium]
MSPGHIVIALVCAAVWGFGFVPSKYAAEHMPPLFFLSLRYAIIVACTIWLAPMPRGHMRPIFFYALSLGIGHFGLFYVGLELGVEATTASIIWLTQVPFTTLLAFALLGDRPGWRTLVGIAIALAGSAFLIGEPRISGEPLAITLVLVSNLLWGVSNVQAKRMPQLNPFALNAWMALYSAPIMLALSLVFERRQLGEWLVPDWRLHASLLYMALGSTVVGYGLWLFLLRRHPVSRTAPFLLLVPMFGALSSVLSLGEEITWRTVLSGLITLGGVALIVLRRPAAAAPSAGS